MMYQLQFSTTLLNRSHLHAPDHGLDLLNKPAVAAARSKLITEQSIGPPSSSLLWLSVIPGLGVLGFLPPLRGPKRMHADEPSEQG